MFRKLIFSVFGRRKTKRLYHALTRQKPCFSEAEIVIDYFYTYPRKGLMIDVGVHFGESCLPYSELGWSIIGFEPDPHNRKRVPTIQGLRLYEEAVSHKDGEMLTFYASDVSSGISSLSSFHTSHRPIAKVKTVSLKTIMEKEGINKVDFLKIDIEGHDLFALKGFPFGKCAPEIILCEFEDYKTVPVGYIYKDLGDFLLEKGYAVYLSEWYPIIKYGSQHQWRSINIYPTKLVDARGWGNYIAVRESEKDKFEKVLHQYLQDFPMSSFKETQT